MRPSDHLKPHPRRPSKILHWDRVWSLVEDCTPESEDCDYRRADEGDHLRASNPRAKIQAANEGLTCYRHFSPQHIFLAYTKHQVNLDQKLNGYHPDVLWWALGGGDYITDLWCGFTGEKQEWLDQRWKHLRQVPASIIFVFYEPAPGSITYPPHFLARGKGAWVITGGETGPKKARSVHPDVERKDRDQCQASVVPFWFMHWGAFFRCCS